MLLSSKSIQPIELIDRIFEFAKYISGPGKPQCTWTFCDYQRPLTECLAGDNYRSIV